jgi:predicted XRE-type DNA-binding protein
VLGAPAGSLAYLKQYGFKTFDSVWDEYYDTVTDDTSRVGILTRLLKKLDQQSEQQKNEIFKKCIPIIEHNWNHFYHGGFEKILWDEMTLMLSDLKKSVGNDLSSS